MLPGLPLALAALVTAVAVGFVLVGRGRGGSGAAGVLAGLVAAAGTGLLLWADAREHRDIQRLWGVFTGWTALLGAGSLTLALLVRSRRQR